MLNHLKNEANKTYTENGAVTYASTLSDCLDLFATIGAIRRKSDVEIITRFSRAFAENADIAMKILFFGRDVRGGLGERYGAFMAQVEKGEKTLHTGTLAPYEIVAPCMDGRYGFLHLSAEERKAMDVTWNALEDFTTGENALVVVDGSGSMYNGARPTPAAVAMSLGIYFAERNTGAFKGHFITFSENPRLVEIKGRDIVEKLRCCMGYNEVANTNVQRVFELILNTALKNRVPQEEMPARIYIVSDMEFDWCAQDAGLTNFEHAKQLFAENGYKLPEVVFWNVASRYGNQPVTMNEQGVALVSGCTPRIFAMVAGGNMSPYAVMMEVLGSERYARISA